MPNWRQILDTINDLKDFVTVLRTRALKKVLAPNFNRLQAVEPLDIESLCMAFVNVYNMIK